MSGFFERKAWLAAVAGLLVAGCIVFAVTTGGERPYQVRAIFDNAGFVIPGEDVKVAGVKVGTVDSLEVTPDNRAAVVLNIKEEGYRDFRSDATCTIRPQSLIGEKFVECKPTQQRAVGTSLPPALSKIGSGPGKGQHLLPLKQTGKPVDLDLVNNIMRKPYTERLSLIINELGIGLAGRGDDLNAVIRRANPALKELDEVLKLLASQNKTLGHLAKDGDTVVGPLARERASVSGFAKSAGEVGKATAERRSALESSIQKLPGFLKELRPTMKSLDGLADEMTPVLHDLGAAAPEISRFLIELGPFAKAGRPALKTLGEAADVGTPAVKAALPVTQDLRSTASSLKPVAENLALLLSSLQRSGGIEQLMAFIFNQASAINGYDSVGHYLRASLMVNTCSTYALKEQQECLAKFSRSTAIAAGPNLTHQAAHAQRSQVVAAQAATAPSPQSLNTKRDQSDAQLLNYLFGQ